eukprot:15358287-Ditylum_brightwellii.AAC.2
MENKPIVVNWKNGTVRKLKNEIIIGWGAGRSASRQYLVEHNFNIAGQRIEDMDICNYFQAVIHNANAVQNLQSQTWYNDALHNPVHWNS